MVEEAEEARDRLARAVFWFRNRAAAAAFSVWTQRVADGKQDEERAGRAPGEGVGFLSST